MVVVPRPVLAETPSSFAALLAPMPLVDMFASEFCRSCRRPEGVALNAMLIYVLVGERAGCDAYCCGSTHP